MSTLNKTAFEALYGLTGTTFPDNTTGQISEGDIRQFGKDIADSFFNTPDDSYTKPFPQVTASGTDTYTATLSPAITAYAAGQRYQVRFTNANTGAATLNLNALGAKSIVKNGGTALAAGDINAGQILILGYDGTNIQVIGGGGGVTTGFVETVTGDGVNNTDPANPVLTFPVASEVDNTPAGGIAATTVQGAINELDTEKAPLASPAFTGTPTAPTASGGTNTTQVATTAFVQARALTLVDSVTGTAVDNTDPQNPVVNLPTATQVANTPAGGIAATNVQTAINELDTEKANLASPTFTGTPAAPTATGGTNTTQVATTAFVQGELAAKANIASPTFTGVPAGPTASGGTNTTQLATTAFVQGENAAKAPLASPALTGTPTAPTAAAGTNTTQLATTAFVQQETIGVQDLFISAAAMWPRVTNGCAPLAQTEIATSLFNIQSLDFDQTTQEFCQFQITLPRNWNNGTVTAEVYWTAASGSGGVVFGLNGGAYSNDDALSTALGTAQTMTDTLITTNDLHITPTSSAITIAGAPADADFIALQLSRNPADGSDTLTADAKVLGIMLHLTTDAAKAA